MIKHIRLENIATYSNPVHVNFKNLNFIYGGNGTGKTTISKLISGEICHPSCTVDFDSQESSDKVLVYNKTFVERNFREVGEIAGIFTLGSEAGDILDTIKSKEDELEKVHSEIRSRNASIENFQQKIRERESAFDDECWGIKSKYDKEFPLAMAGARGSKKVFSKRCLEEYRSLDGTPAKSITEIQKLYQAAYTKGAAQYLLYDQLDLLNARLLDEHRLLRKSITGKADSDIGRFIEYLGASDWVKRGIELAEHSGGKCPFCSQSLPKDIYSDIEAFFDNAYQQECNELSRYLVDYSAFHETIIKYLAQNVSEGCDIISYEKLQSKSLEYQRCVEKNQTLIQRKIETPSIVIEVEPCSALLTEINKMILEFNATISENNTLVEHQKETQKQCQEEVWHLIASELGDTIKMHLKQCDGWKQAIKNCENQREDFAKKAESILGEIKEKRAAVSNVQYTIQAINRILEGYGFTGFMLEENEVAPGTYKIIRPDGKDAKESLSEGEYNFITFLYFYYLILGSNSPDDLGQNKVIVIDDPISSLDSNVLFIVSSLVKNILSLCREGKQSIKQVIVSTHNIYFHKEITFLGGRDHWPKTQTAFFIIRKKNQISSIVEYSENQIQSSYEMMWDEIRSPQNGTAKSIFNTMRRILENYFNITGGMDYEKCISEFEGEDRIICKSLISCINEQSHTISDDYFMCLADSEVSHYLRIFKEIFEKMNHLSHYNMMMRIDN